MKKRPALTQSRQKRSVPKSPAAVASLPEPPRPASRQLQAGKEPASYWRKYRFYILGFVGALLVFGACVWLVRRHVVLGREVGVFHWINDWPDRLRPVLVAITALGSFWCAAVLVGLAFVLRLHQLAWRLALSVFTAFGLLVFCKEFFARLRPEEFIADVHVRVIETSHAFPSAHTAIAAVLALSIRSYLPIPAIWQWLVVVLWVGGVGLSRIYLGVHTPLDVVAGAALGVGVVCFWRILPKFVKRPLRLK